MMRIALLGAGTVGGALARIVAARRRLGLEVVGAFVRNATRDREGIPRLTTEPFELLDDRSVEAVVEVLGGEEPARSLILAAFERGKHVVTANKLVLATHWAELHAAARAARRQLRYEAAVAGAVPLIAALHELAAARPRTLRGILNGTTNFILTKMEEHSTSFEEALRAAQAAGYAEPDPASDVDGFDPAYKLAICVSILERRPFDPALVRRQSIRDVTPERLAEARGRGRRLRHVAAADFRERAVKARVELEEVDETSLLALARGPENVVEIDTDLTGRIVLAGPGAGGEATASAILGDLIAIQQGMA